MTMRPKSPAFLAGQQLGLMTYGFSKSGFATADGMVSALENHNNPEYGKFQKVLCKYASEAFKQVGEMGSFEYNLFKEAAHTQEWYPELDKFSDAVLIALGNVVKQAREERHLKIREDISKKAAMNLGTIVPSVAQGVVSNTPDLLKTVAGVGVGGGAIAGSLAWLMNRHVAQDEDKAEGMKAKIRYYRKLTQDIRNQLGSNPAAPQDVRQAVNDVI